MRTVCRGKSRARLTSANIDRRHGSPIDTHGRQGEMRTGNVAAPLVWSNPGL